MPVDDVKAQAGFQLELLGGHLEHPRDGITGGARDQHTRDALIQEQRGVDGLIVDGFFGGGISGVRVEREPAVRGPLERREQGGLLSRAADEADGDAMRCRPAKHEAVGGSEDCRHPDGDRDDDHRVPVREWRQGFVLAGGHVGGCRSPSAASRPARWGTTTYFGSLADATPASKVPKRQAGTVVWASSAAVSRRYTGHKRIHRAMPIRISLPRYRGIRSTRPS